MTNARKRQLYSALAAACVGALVLLALGGIAVAAVYADQAHTEALASRQQVGQLREQLREARAAAKARDAQADRDRRVLTRQNARLEAQIRGLREWLESQGIDVPRDVARSAIPRQPSGEPSSSAPHSRTSPKRHATPKSRPVDPPAAPQTQQPPQRDCIVNLLGICL